MNAVLAREIPTTERVTSLKPMGWFESLLLFLIPAAGMVLAHYAVYPYLKSLGLPPFESYVYATVPVLLAMLIAALVAYRREGYPWTWDAFSQRFRLGRMDGKIWLWTGELHASRFRFRRAGSAAGAGHAACQHLGRRAVVAWLYPAPPGTAVWSLGLAGEWHAVGILSPLQMVGLARAVGRLPDHPFPQPTVQEQLASDPAALFAQRPGLDHRDGDGFDRRGVMRILLILGAVVVGLVLW
jgi:hypothetical protein